MTRLAVDFGTSHTVAVVELADGRVEALLFRSSPLVPSAVFSADGRLVAGHDADYGARLDPARYEPNPKRRIDDGHLLLGDVEVPVVDAVATLFRMIAAEARRVTGGAVGEVVLAHPAGWGTHRKAILRDAAEAADLGPVTLIAEPVAAAGYFAVVLGQRVPDGSSLVVYDLGGGTFDISVVRRAPAGGWEVTTSAGLDDVGGVDLDAAIVDWVGRQVADASPAEWARLTAPAPTADGAADRRRRRQLWDDVRAAREQLSGASQVTIAVPAVEREVHLTRSEFEDLARPWLDRTVALTTATMLGAGVGTAALAGVFLVGGGSRTPLVASLLHRALGVAPIAIDQPELAVARGCLTDALVDAPAAPPPHAPPAPLPDPGVAAPSAASAESGIARFNTDKPQASADRLRPLWFLGGLVWLGAMAFVLAAALRAFEDTSINYDINRIAVNVYAGVRAPLGPTAALVLLGLLLLVGGTGPAGGTAAGALGRLLRRSAVAASTAVVVLLYFATGLADAMDPNGYCSSSIFGDPDVFNGFDWIDAAALAGRAGGQLWWVVAAAPILVAGGLVSLALRRPVDPLAAAGDRAGTLRAAGTWAAGGVLIGVVAQSYLYDQGLTCEQVNGWNPDWTTAEYTPVNMLAQSVLTFDFDVPVWGLVHAVAFWLGLVLTLTTAGLLALTVRRAVARTPQAARSVRFAAGGVLVVAGVLAALHAWRERVAWQGETWREPDPLVSGVHAVWESVIGWTTPRVATALTVVLLHVLLAALVVTARRDRRATARVATRD
ncbi:Hsp70 family protein [Virgisporangium aurantiacum]|uniref:Hsp70 protein n=1 Tax=Virgisporangium aurantiacum TaxID=175570 RepID=A0A8J4DZ23_9ACTN|nr:Hsp70 family protein [Virgisporangium aurantiacum]GIJ56245.1 hypothetical protein Vau01_037610 [Virgisporangium aurantiacum]